MHTEATMYAALFCIVSLSLDLVNWCRISLGNTKSKCPSKSRLAEFRGGCYISEGLKRPRQCGIGQQRVEIGYEVSLQELRIVIIIPYCA